ncbi:MAG: DUF3604 domain-containing protein [bacterium]
MVINASCIAPLWRVPHPPEFSLLRRHNSQKHFFCATVLRNDHGDFDTMTQRLTLCALLLCFFCQPSIYAIDGQYLPRDLRSRVEQLKLDVQRVATNDTNAEARARLTWEWINAYAVNGGYIPVNSTQVIAGVLSADARRGNWFSALDATIAEFIFLDENPDALGPLRATPGPFTAGDMGTITQTYTVGKQDIQTGGGFLIARHFMADFGDWQTSDPAADNFISISSSNSRVRFVTSTAPMRGMHGGFRNTRATLSFNVASGTLSEGDVVTITYGDQTAGGRGLSMPSFASDAMPLPIYIAFTDSGPYYSLPIAPIQISGSNISGVAGFAPSIVAPSEPFILSVRAQDRFYNRATGTIPDWQISKNGEPWITVESTGAITLVETGIDEPGTYFLTIRSADGAVTGDVNPIIVSNNDQPRIFWGDTHGHSGFAEGIGTPDRFMQWARDDARLDFVTHSEHDIWLDDAEWTTLINNVRNYTEEGKFVAYLGYEWSVNTTSGGHHNVLFRTPDQRQRIPAQFYPTLTKLYQGLRATADPDDVVVIPHAHQAGDYRISDPELEPLVEIMSQHGNFEWFGRMYLKHGHQVGFIAASDNHLSQPGYSAPLGGSLSQRGGLGAILAKARTTDAIFDGMKNLQAYATTGDRIILDFKVNDTPMGQRGAFAQTRRISGKVIGTAPIDTITLIRNDNVLWEQDYLHDKEDRLSKQGSYLLTFASASDPHHNHDNPRGWRTWEGTIEVEGATLEEIKAVDASFPLQRVNRSADNPNRLTFSTRTRGDGSSYRLRLNDVQRTSKLRFDLLEAAESGGAPTVYRPHQRVPADSFTLNFRDLQEGQVQHRQRIDDYTDTTTLRRIISTGEREVSFEFTDTGNRQGDYYFIRVVQSNDAIAWSSPVWIGGHAPK